MTGFALLSRHARVAALFMLVAVVAGCATTAGVAKVEEGGGTVDVPAESIPAMSDDAPDYLIQVGDEVQVVFKLQNYKEGDSPWEYRIEVGDKLEVAFTPAPVDDDYVIDMGDVLDISFMQNWQLDVTRTVRPDGRVSLLAVGDLNVAGMTVEGVRNRLIDLYRDSGLLQGEPRISVNVNFANFERLDAMSSPLLVRPDGAVRLPGMRNDIRVAGMTLDEASTAISQASAGVLRNNPVVSVMLMEANPLLGEMNGIFRIQPDGRVSIPRIGSVQFAGYSVEELSERLAAAAHGVVFNPVETSVNIQTATGARIYVGGEVKIAGVYPLTSTPSALQAIIMAQGITDDGRMNSVLVMRRNPEGKPHVFKLNLSNALTKGMTENDISLRAFDVVYVPKKPIAKADLFVEQYIDELVPFQNTLGISANYYLNKQEVKTNVPNTATLTN